MHLCDEKMNVLSKNPTEEKIRKKCHLILKLHSSTSLLCRCLIGNEYAVSIYDGHKEQWTLMGFSSWGWCYPPLLLTTFIAQTTVPSPASGSGAAQCLGVHVCSLLMSTSPSQPRGHFKCPSNLFICRLIGLQHQLNAQDVNGWRQVRRVWTWSLSWLPLFRWQYSAGQPDSTFRVKGHIFTSSFRLTLTHASQLELIVFIKTY